MENNILKVREHIKYLQHLIDSDPSNKYVFWWKNDILVEEFVISVMEQVFKQDGYIEYVSDETHDNFRCTTYKDAIIILDILKKNIKNVLVPLLVDLNGTENSSY